MSLEQLAAIDGTWIVTQKWNNAQPYKFRMTIKNGIVSVDGGFQGVVSQLGATSYISIAIANYGQQSVTAYVGNFVGTAMGGLMTGTQSGRSFTGQWSAQELQLASANERAYTIGE